MLAQKTGDSFFEIDFSRKCYAANRSSVTLYKICGESGYINLGKVFQGTIMECKQFVFDNISHLADPAEHYFGNYPALVQQCGQNALYSVAILNDKLHYDRFKIDCNAFQRAYSAYHNKSFIYCTRGVT